MSMIRYGTVWLSFWSVVLVEVPFVSREGVKLRPAVVLFEERDNIVIAGITSNLKMQGVFIPKEEGIVVDSVVKLNYIFTVSKQRIRKRLTHLSFEKKLEICSELANRMSFCLNNQWRKIDAKNKA